MVKIKWSLILRSWMYGAYRSSPDSRRACQECRADKSSGHVGGGRRYNARLHSAGTTKRSCSAGTRSWFEDGPRDHARLDAAQAPPAGAAAANLFEELVVLAHIAHRQRGRVAAAAELQQPRKLLSQLLCYLAAWLLQKRHLGHQAVPGCGHRRPLGVLIPHPFSRGARHTRKRFEGQQDMQEVKRRELCQPCWQGKRGRRPEAVPAHLPSSAPAHAPAATHP